MQRWVWIPECLAVVARFFVDFFGFVGCGSRGLRVLWCGLLLGCRVV